MAHMPHRPRREQDEWVCSRCATRWAVSEETPTNACVDTRGDDRERRRIVPATTKRQLRVVQRR